MRKAGILLESVEELTWEMYVEISDAIAYIDVSKVDDELAEGAKRYSYWAGMQTMAKKHLAQVNRLAEQHRAVTAKAVTNTLTVAGTRATDKKVEAGVLLDTEYQSILKRIEECEMRYDLLKNLTRALEHRKDNLIQISSNNRQETKLYSN